MTSFETAHTSSCHVKQIIKRITRIFGKNSWNWKQLFEKWQKITFIISSISINLLENSDTPLLPEFQASHDLGTLSNNSLDISRLSGQISTLEVKSIDVWYLLHGSHAFEFPSNRVIFKCFFFNFIESICSIFSIYLLKF